MKMKRVEAKGIFFEIFPRNHEMLKFFSFVTANFTIRTLNRDLDVEIYSAATRKYLCFNHRWKLIATVVSKTFFFINVVTIK